MLTREELLAVAKCASKYPVGHGYSFFSDDDVGDPWDAASRLKRDPKSIAFC